MPEDVAGTTQTIVRGNGTPHLIDDLAESDAIAIHKYGVQEGIKLNDDLGAKEAVGVLGHEAFVHADRGADKLSSFDKTYNTRDKKERFKSS